MSGKNKIKIIKQNISYNEIYFILDNAITMGEQLLLENIEEEIDPNFNDVVNNILV